jgi:hypothetical protein
MASPAFTFHVGHIAVPGVSVNRVFRNIVFNDPCMAPYAPPARCQLHPVPTLRLRTRDAPSGDLSVFRPSDRCTGGATAT